MKTIFLMLLAFLMVTLTTFNESPKQKLQNLEGTYSDIQAVDWGHGTYGKRTFTFEKGYWTLEFVLSFDPMQAQKIFTFRTEGNFEVLKPSEAVEGAYDAIFYEDQKRVTLHMDNPEIIEGFGFTNCGLEVDIEKDISSVGCSFWQSVAQCAEDHDLMKLDDEGHLYFGQRPEDNDMCTADRRPTSLTLPVEKINL
ncbi:MAG: hypothetical protein AAGD88_03390 [Bacteroidota bacterium]